MRIKYLMVWVAISLMATINVNAQTNKTTNIQKIRLLDVYEIPHNFLYDSTTVGGLSGIEYDAVNDCYYMICDDRSAINPSRYYTASIKIHQQKIDTVLFTGVHFLKDEFAQVYPGSKQDRKRTPDPEALRYNPTTHQMVWSSEGDRIVNVKDTLLNNPAITIIQPNGTWVDTFTLPQNLYMHASENGPRQNGVLEGMTFSDNYQTLYVNVEEPLYEDGPKADLTPNKAFIRLYKFDVATKKNTAQYAYELDPVAYAPIIPGAFKVNGIPDMLDLGNGQLLIIERSFSTGRLACTIKVFTINVKGATNIINNPSLIHNNQITLVKKQLLLNMDDLGVFTDNIEGVTFGPVLPNGHQTLLFVADNNFAAYQRSQFFLFEIIP